MFGRQLIAVAGDTSQIAIWDIRDPAHANKGVTMSTDGTSIRFIAFAPAENVLAAACIDGTVRLFDAKSGNQTASIARAESTPIVIAFNTDGKLLAIGLENGTIQIWDCTLAKKLGEVRG
jgi:WD40 repeat protein